MKTVMKVLFSYIVIIYQQNLEADKWNQNQENIKTMDDPLWREYKLKFRKAKKKRR